ncbi:hypothetical protein PCH_Pc21g18440 [Penicillium rubens Wisconsin 54-1255]|uniref:Uncharacterized protein n=1 Tax=Penicillium rubens (strain ATCC 28089 / DSM 1075 / NRRL 1951 / Wisconsin 54-1255) TaxID=500485 RepID=B6HHR5_PENRW|nr:hypothetical protein PCH_Pc21g18440 [Penicillium rubens Wisconsin 54-1255]
MSVAVAVKLSKKDTISSEELNSLLYKFIRKLHAHPLRPNLLYEGGRYISDEISGDLDRSVLPFSRDSEIGLRWTGDLTVDKTCKRAEIRETACLGDIFIFTEKSTPFIIHWAGISLDDITLPHLTCSWARSPRRGVLGSLMAKGFGAHAVFSKVCIVSCLNGAQGAKLPTYLTLRMALVVVLRGPVFRSGKGSRRYTCLPQGYLPNLERTHFPNCSFMVGFREWASAKPTPWSKLKLASIVDCEV